MNETFLSNVFLVIVSSEVKLLGTCFCQEGLTHDRSNNWTNAIACKGVSRGRKRRPVCQIARVSEDERFLKCVHSATGRRNICTSPDVPPARGILMKRVAFYFFFRSSASPTALALNHQSFLSRFGQLRLGGRELRAVRCCPGFDMFRRRR